MYVRYSLHTLQCLHLGIYFTTFHPFASICFTRLYIALSSAATFSIFLNSPARIHALAPKPFMFGT